MSTYKCKACGYTAEVLDEPKTDIYYTLETKICLRCKELVPVAVEAHAASRIGGDEGGTGHEYRYENDCPKCHSKDVQGWDAKHSCPKCREHMVLETH